MLFKLFRALAYELVHIVVEVLVLSHGIDFVRNVIRWGLSITDILEPFHNVIDLMIDLTFTPILGIISSFCTTEAKRQRPAPLGTQVDRPRTVMRAEGILIIATIG